VRTGGRRKSLNTVPIAPKNRDARRRRAQFPFAHSLARSDARSVKKGRKKKRGKYKSQESETGIFINRAYIDSDAINLSITFLASVHRVETRRFLSRYERWKLHHGRKMSLLPDIVGQISFSAATWKASSFFPDDEPIECNFHKHPRNLSAVLRALPPIISSRCRSSLAPRPSFNGIFISRIMSEEIGTHPRRNGKLGGERKGRRDASRSYDPRGEATVISRIRIR